MTTTAITAVVWVVVMLVTPPESPKVLERFVNQVQPPGPGWSRLRQRLDITPVDSLVSLCLRFILSVGVLFGGLLGTGAFLLHQQLGGWIGLVVTVVCVLPLTRGLLRSRMGVA